MRRLCEKCGDDFELRTYERMSALKVVDEPRAPTPTSSPATAWWPSAGRTSSASARPSNV